MPTDQTPVPASRRLVLFWRKVRACYRLANILTHHVLGFVFKTVVAAYFVFGVLLLALRYAVLPHIDLYKADIEQLVARAIGQPVAIATLQASWDGLRPRFILGNVVIRDRDGREALALPSVTATLSWWSAALGTVRLQRLEIDRPDLVIRRGQDGKLYVAGMQVPDQADKEGQGGNWILSQHEIVVRAGRIRWDDNRRGAPELLLNDVNLVLRNHWQHHDISIRATPPRELAAPIDFRASFNHPPFATRIADASRWSGVVYADLQNTDLMAWKAYADIPSIDMQQGHGSIRAWLDFDRAKIADFTADLTLANTVVRLGKDLPLLNLDRLSGRVAVREEMDSHMAVAAPAFGVNGYTIALENFSMRTNDGLMLPATTTSEKFEPAKNGQPSKTVFTATVLDLRTLANFAERLPLSADQRQLLADFAPRGQLRDFTARWQGDYPALSSYEIKGKFIGLSLREQAARSARPQIGRQAAQAAVPPIPGFENLTGEVAMNDHGGAINLASEKVQLELPPGIFADPLVLFDKLSMQANWVFQEQDKVSLQVNKLDFAQDGLVGSLSGTDVLSLNPQRGKSPGIVDFTGHIDKFDLKKTGRYLPLLAQEQLRGWLTGALAGGSVRDVEIRLKGDLKDFPFHAQASAARPKGEFSVAGKIVNGSLIYAPNLTRKNSSAPLWPLLEDIQGTIAFDRTRMEINAEQAKTHGVNLSSVKAVIDDFLPPQNIILKIDGNAAGPLQEFVGFTKDSLVQDMIGGLTDATKASGNAKLALKLELPLARMQDAKVLGKLQFANNDINLFPGLPTLSASTGALGFSEKILNLDGIRANFLGGPMALSGGGPYSAASIRAEGVLTSEGARKFMGQTTQRLTQRISGSARYTASIKALKKRFDVVVESNLQGMALDLPAPLRKEANEALAAKFELTGQASNDAAVSREEIKLSMGAGLAARYEREKAAEREEPWRLVRGGIGVNAPIALPGSGLSLAANLKSLNFDEWLDLIASFAVPGKGREGGGRADASDFSEYISPDALAVRATEMTIFGRKLDNVVLGATRQKDVWQTNIESAQASGSITYAGQGKGVVTARLSSLIIGKTVASEMTELLQGKNTTKDLPALDIVADNFELLGKRLGQLKLVANNVRTGAANEWRIDSLLINCPDAKLTAKGKWTTGAENLSEMTYALDLVDAGKFLGRLGFVNVLSGGKGKMEGEIDWKGVPYSLDSPSLSGRLHLDLEGGQFLKGDPGAARLLSILSLQSLQARLTLDFRDLFSKGFAFDSVTTDASIAKGVLSTNNFKMRGVVAAVHIDGSVDIVRETQNLHVVIVPDFNMGALSLAYIAINPVFGVGSLLGQWFLHDPLSKAFTDEFQWTGPWDKAIVTKLEHKSIEVSKNVSGATIPAESAK